MQQPNFWILFLTALIPLVIGFIWYGKGPIGALWLKESGVDPSPPPPKKMVLTFVLTYVFGLLLSFLLLMLCSHQFHLGSLMADEATSLLLKDPNSVASQDLKHFATTYGLGFKTFKHGALHGFLSGLFGSLAMLGIPAMFEKRSLKYILVHIGYWTVVCMLMGGVISAYF